LEGFAELVNFQSGVNEWRNNGWMVSVVNRHKEMMRILTILNIQSEHSELCLSTLSHIGFLNK